MTIVSEIVNRQWVVTHINHYRSLPPLGEWMRHAQPQTDHTGPYSTVNSHCLVFRGGGSSRINKNPNSQRAKRQTRLFWTLKLESWLLTPESWLLSPEGWAFTSLNAQNWPTVYLRSKINYLNSQECSCLNPPWVVTWPWLDLWVVTALSHWQADSSDRFMSDAYWYLPYSRNFLRYQSMNDDILPTDDTDDWWLMTDKWWLMNDYWWMMIIDTNLIHGFFIVPFFTLVQ